MPSSTITRKGQITLPKAIRAALRVQPGDRVAFHVREDGTVVVQAETVELSALRGMLRDAVRPRGRRLTVAEMDDAVASAVLAGVGPVRARGAHPDGGNAALGQRARRRRV